MAGLKSTCGMYDNTRPCARCGENSRQTNAVPEHANIQEEPLWEYVLCRTCLLELAEGCRRWEHGEPNVDIDKKLRLVRG